ncbi:hypothetical protein E2C01_006546 [Portunus trituberculatus]|uniref:Uncharacterized protein n=1 Tax=Portunus trituberculatus TaxID=210409 RepID=A0A5B7CWK1_PORTR|nr:hypothetical protein [Portunus trituberculatus]
MSSALVKCMNSDKRKQSIHADHHTSAGTCYHQVNTYPLHQTTATHLLLIHVETAVGVFRGEQQQQRHAEHKRCIQDVTHIEDIKYWILPYLNDLTQVQQPREYHQAPPRQPHQTRLTPLKPAGRPGSGSDAVCSVGSSAGCSVGIGVACVIAGNFILGAIWGAEQEGSEAEHEE